MLPGSQLQRTDYRLILITIFTSRPCICSQVTITNSNQGRRHPFRIRLFLVWELLLSNISSTHDIILICFIANPFVGASIALTHLVLWNSITSIFKLRDPTMLVNNCSGCWRRLVSIIYICCMISDCAKINVQQSDYGKRFRVSRRQEVIISAIQRHVATALSLWRIINLKHEKNLKEEVRWEILISTAIVKLEFFFILMPFIVIRL